MNTCTYFSARFMSFSHSDTSSSSSCRRRLVVVVVFIKSCPLLMHLFSARFLHFLHFFYITITSLSCINFAFLLHLSASLLTVSAILLHFFCICSALLCSISSALFSHLIRLCILFIYIFTYISINYLSILFIHLSMLLQNR